MTRPLSDLVNEDDDALPLIEEWIRRSPVSARMLACTSQAGSQALRALQVTTRSPLGALAYHSGGLLIDAGWLRVYGAGCPDLPRAVDRWNGIGSAKPRLNGGLVVADDAIGGFYSLSGATRTVHYFAPDTLQWEDMERGFTDWLAVMLGEGLALWYTELRWEGWQNEVRALSPDRGLHIWPPLPFKGPPLAERSRRAVPMEELWDYGVGFWDRVEVRDDA